MKEWTVMSELLMVRGNRSPTLVLAFRQVVGQLDRRRCLMAKFTNSVPHERTTFVEGLIKTRGRDGGWGHLG